MFAFSSNKKLLLFWFDVPSTYFSFFPIVNTCPFSVSIIKCDVPIPIDFIFDKIFISIFSWSIIVFISSKFVNSFGSKLEMKSSNSPQK